MTRIKILPESVKNKIAAGEVIEGPFSVVKELMENSIDAKATEIDVDIYGSGFRKILIKDNGTGIHKDDLPLAVQNHATSKISDISDIEKIMSYGFRGEALASISSISKLTILSRSIDEDIGAKLVSENGHHGITEFAGARGTTIIVENLFYNIPARKKFLGTKSTELRKIREVFLKIALANPEINFSFSTDEKRVITLTSVKKIEDRIEQIYGKTAIESLDHGRLKDLKTEIWGFLSKPDYLKSSRSMQFLYVNGRCIDYKYLGFFLSKAYEAIAPKGRHPAAIIFLTIDPELIDVNIHPAKKEIKFWDQGYVNSLILNLCEKILGKVHGLNIGYLTVDKIERRNKIPEQIVNSFANAGNTHEEQLTFKDNKPDSCIAYGSSANNENFRLNHLIREAGRLYNEINSQDYFKLLGIIFDTYIIIEKDDALCFIDFHAAHERTIYDSLINKNVRLETQNLIFPQVIDLSIEDYQIFLEKKDYFNDTLFDMDIFSDNSIVVRGIPAIVKDMDIEGFISDCLESLKKDEDHILDVKKTIAEKAACHSARRSGDSLTVEDANLIASRVLNGDYGLRCPHGRPYIYRLEKKDLEKVFKRI